MNITMQYEHDRPHGSYTESLRSRRPQTQSAWQIGLDGADTWQPDSCASSPHDHRDMAITRGIGGCGSRNPADFRLWKWFEARPRDLIHGGGTLIF